MPRKLLFALTTLLVALMVMPSAFAFKPVREVHPGQDDVIIAGACAFPVLGHIEGIESVTTFTDRQGNPVKQIATFPGNKLT